MCIKAIVSGRVQGVFFRQSTKDKADTLGLTGHAVNLADGNVEVVACGNETAVDQLLEWLHQGPQLASVDRVDYRVVETTAPALFTTG